MKGDYDMSILPPKGSFHSRKLLLIHFLLVIMFTSYTYLKKSTDVLLLLSEEAIIVTMSQQNFAIIGVGEKRRDDSRAMESDLWKHEVILT